MQTEFPYDAIEVDQNTKLTLHIYEKNIVLEDDCDDVGMKMLQRQMRRHKDDNWRLFRGHHLIAEKIDGKERWHVWT